MLHLWRGSTNSFLLFFCLSGATAFAIPRNELPIQYTTRPPETDVPELRPGSTAQILNDWAKPFASAANQPDRSFKTIWVRTFPLVTVPLGDPYPPTQDINNIDIANAGGLNIYELNGAKLLGTTKSLHLDFSKVSFKIAGKSVKLDRLWIIPIGSEPSTLTWDKTQKNGSGKSTQVGVQLRGQFIVRQTLFESDDLGKPHFLDQQLWSVINVVKLSDYLNSVVPSEIISSWHQQTMQAQAIAARTYGTFEMAIARAHGSDWDVDPTTWFQSYRGVQFYSNTSKTWRQVELPDTAAAVTATNGEIVTYNGEVIQAFFSANSGGTTCTASECFGVADLPYLVQEDDAAGIRSVAGGTWGAKASITPKSIQEILTELGLTVSEPVQVLEELSLGPSGRVWRLRVRLQSGATLDLDSMQSRKMMRLYGPIRSFLYSLDNSLVSGKQGIIGYGYGHGVGMSQWGAQLFALQGWTAHQIISYYYKNTTIKKVN